MGVWGLKRDEISTQHQILHTLTLFSERVVFCIQEVKLVVMSSFCVKVELPKSIEDTKSLTIKIKVSKRLKINVSKRKTLMKKGYTWVKGKGAIKTKEVYSHPFS